MIKIIEESEHPCKNHCKTCWIWRGKGHGGYMFKCRFCDMLISDTSFLLKEMLNVFPAVNEELFDIDICANCVVTMILRS